MHKITIESYRVEEGDTSPVVVSDKDGKVISIGFKNQQTDGGITISCDHDSARELYELLEPFFKA